MSDLTGIAAKIASSGAIQVQDSRALSQGNLAGADRSKIEKAAQDFETVLLTHWLEQSEQSFATVPGSDPDQDQDGDPGHDQFQGLGMQALASSLTKSGGIGIAKMIVRQLERAAVTNTGISAGPDQPGKERP